MLGIRKYRGAAIDLWQGNPEEFACDLISDEVAGGLSSAAVNRYRHLALALKLKDDPSPLQSLAMQAMDEIKNFLESNNHADDKFPQRITLILNSSLQYDTFQTKLFETF